MWNKQHLVQCPRVIRQGVTSRVLDITPLGERETLAATPLGWAGRAARCP